MEFHQLVYFVAVVETGGFSRAAQRCNVAQPSLSQQIMKLEQELGQELFDRSGRRVTLTDAGRVLLPRAQKILDEMQGIRHGLQREVSEGHGALSVGFIPTIAPFVLPKVIAAFSQAYPHACLSVQEDFTQVLVDGLVAGSLDVAIMSLPVSSRQIETQELLTEPLFVAARQFGMLAHQENFRIKELELFPFIALSEVHCLGEQVHSFCYQHNLNLNVVCHTTQLSTVQNCVALGLGISLVPRALALCDDSRQVLYSPVNDGKPERKIVAATRAGKTRSFLSNQFIELVRLNYPQQELPLRA